MEALKERGDVSSWNDDRLDELSGRVDAGFAKVDRDMKEGFAKVDARFEKVEGEMKEGFAAVDKRFEKVDARFEKVDARFEKVDARFEKVEGQMKEGFERAGQQLERATQSLGKQMNEGFASVMGQTEARVDRIEGRRAKFQGGIWGILGYAIGSVVTALVTHFT